MLGASPVIPSSGSLSLPMKIKSTSNELGYESFYLQISSLNHQLHLDQIQSSPIYVMKYQLHVELNIKDRWFKDHGGAKNWIKLTIKLYNEKGNQVLNRRVPLQLRLYYQNDKDLLINQKIFKRQNKNSLEISQTTGEIDIYVRIEEVTRNHQHNKFIIKIEPDLDLVPSNNLIGSIFTKPIEVLSKPQSITSNKTKMKRNFSNMSEDHSDETDERVEDESISSSPNLQEKNNSSNSNTRNQYQYDEILSKSQKKDHFFDCDSSISLSCSSMSDTPTSKTFNLNEIQTNDINPYEIIETMNRINESIKDIETKYSRYSSVLLNLLISYLLLIFSYCYRVIAELINLQKIVQQKESFNNLMSHSTYHHSFDEFNFSDEIIKDPFKDEEILED